MEILQRHKEDNSKHVSQKTTGFFSTGAQNKILLLVLFPLFFSRHRTQTKLPKLLGGALQ